LFCPSALREIITLKVGKGGQQIEFTVHKDVICEASPFFKAACKPENMKPDSRVIELPEDEPEVIQIMVYWIYHNEICINQQVLKREYEGDRDSCVQALTTPWGLFAQLYIVGKKYKMSSLQNDAIDALLDHGIWNTLTICIIPWVYENTIKGDKLRKLFFLMAKRDLNRSHLAQFHNQLSLEFLFDMTYDSVPGTNEPGPKLEWNESMIDLDDPYEDFCSQLHNQESCGGDCEDYKVYDVVGHED
jgi:BTB/POZ domain